MTIPKQEQSASVPQAKQAEESYDYLRWWWTEGSVWTERMLVALEKGVKGGKWYSLIDKVYNPSNLQSAFGKVRANGGASGVDHQSVEHFEKELARNIARLSDELQKGTYVPQAVRRVWIPKPGTSEQRPLGIPTIRDRVVQGALRNVLEPIFERDFAEHSYGFRRLRGCEGALDRVRDLLKQGYTHVVDVDLKGYFDSIPHDRLLAEVGRKVTDERILGLLRQFLIAGIRDGLDEQTPERGTPQGAVISPLLSNIYLDPLDHVMAGLGYEMVRYADDFVVMCRSRAAAEAALEAIRCWTVEADLVLHPTKTRLVEATVQNGFDFLGYHFRSHKQWPREKSMAKMRETIRTKTRRLDGRSLGQIVIDLNSTLIGWYGYFRRSAGQTFRTVDQFVRGRLRNLLRKRLKLPGLSTRTDQQRWPNPYFADQGLVSLRQTWERHNQSC